MIIDYHFEDDSDVCQNRKKLKKKKKKTARDTTVLQMTCNDDV